ncbi:hypothetical protein CALCODRAFT_554579 [Calocera cornea HHB12733]|uniref:Uncharacterized protein n=1 Tax=Calocera cornea HHB12733 TaxID=1353952 RepID=A0A165H274_9BASI|nr:hypothetical protein CALCODRAFT_554579 [Calocera cornea HHB12733]
MFGSTLLTTVVAALFTSIVSASPVARQGVTVELGWITNDKLGGAWTKMTQGNSSAGVPIGISPNTGGADIRQLFALYGDASGDNTYTIIELDTGNYVSTLQTTNSDTWSSGFEMLQTSTVAADNTVFKVSPGYDEGSWYIQPNTPSNTQLGWYSYDDPAAPFIPIILNEPLQEPDQSWTFHPL